MSDDTIHPDEPEVLDPSPQPEQQATEDTSDEDTLKFTQGLRRKFVSQLIDKNGKISEDKVDRGFMLQALADMDRAALGNMRVKADKKAGDAAAQAAGFIAELLKRGEIRTLHKNDEPIEREIPALPSDLPDPEVVPGEAQFHADVLNPEDFFPTEKEALDSRPAIANER